MTDDRDVTAIAGIGETRAGALAEAGFETLADDAAALRGHRDARRHRREGRGTQGLSRVR
jgi:predicted flap endonuclease-1-like 5' DNA nuclease